MARFKFYFRAWVSPVGGDTEIQEETEETFDVMFGDPFKDLLEGDKSTESDDAEA